MKLYAKTRLHADFAGGMQPVSTPAYPELDEALDTEENRQLLIDGSCICASCRPDLDQQPDMAPPVALVNGDHFESLVAPLEHSDLEGDQLGDMASVSANLDAGDQKLVRDYEKSVKALVKVVQGLSASTDGALNELADDIEDSIAVLTRKLKIMKGL